jgi:hypothetical protein
MKNTEPRTPHFLNLNQDIVASSQDEKCGLKYDIFSQYQKPIEILSASNCSGWRK